MAADGIGARLKRKEDFRFLTGHGRYTDDIALPGQTYAVFVRSPHAHANIKSVNSKAALASPGCLGVYVNADMEAAGIKGGLPDGHAHPCPSDPRQG